ncbi:hypothetical protein [Devosia sp. 63-57]|uniref:hypothetical protein n=1 Tax=Devosia sp. 63-57 TaxID=1895751 RepID=UPI00086B8680|nr:hypothetical protein [Devosia sp. 63-57]ODU88888.1 MAG: hypothetical protein ABT14_01080 [Pelagibacterium sp. SCN 63-17]OJX43217.1 MAG: hypothetical protein BGO80_17665 [Devosia sp. 63-57]
MNEHLEALSIYLATLTPSPSGWLTLDRDRAAASVGVGRVKLARILSKAEKALGIEVKDDRIRYLSQDEINSRDNKPKVAAALAAIDALMTRRQGKMSRVAPL